MVQSLWRTPLFFIILRRFSSFVGFGSDFNDNGKPERYYLIITKVPKEDLN